jgi:uncharacterized protein with beta-barrel porin domain
VFIKTDQGAWGAFKSVAVSRGAYGSIFHILPGSIFVAAALLLQSGAAQAACSTSGTNPVTLSCAANTTTTATTNTTSPNAATSDQTQDLNASIVGQVNSSVTVDGFGLSLVSTLPGATISMTNNGTISTNQGAGNRALQINAGAPGNFGAFTYSGSGNVSNTGGGDALSISNSGTGDISITVSGTSTVSATATGNGIVTGGVTGNVTVTVQSGGTVQGGTAVSIGGTSTVNTVTNSGTIQGIGTLSSGVSANNTTIQNTGGSITAVASGIFGDNLTITNNGSSTISATGVGGVAIHALGAVGFANITNLATGTVSATNTNGIAVATTTAVISNAGAMTGALDGVNTQNTTTLTNMSTGVITGTGRSGVRVGSNASIDNSGTITGLIGIVFRDAGAGFGAPTNGSVFNAGTITGTGGTAINFAATAGAGPFTLTIAPTSVINGNVLGTGADTFQLGGTGTGSFDVGSFGATQQYRGFAAFNKVGTSTWTLSGSGAQNWTISQGTLIGDTNSLAGAAITDNAALVFSQNFNGTHAGAISGSGTLAKTGSGTLVLTGTNTYAGATTVSGGILEVDGSIAASQLTTVNSGTALTGTGTVGNALIAGGAMFAPGNGTPGTSMTIAGNLAFQSGAIYLVQLNPTAASFTNVTGTATLNGATVDAMFANGTYVSKQYTIVSASGGVSGTFGSLVNTNLPSGFHTTLSSDGNNVFLNLAMNFTPPPGSGLNVNQQNVGNAISAFFNSNGSIPIVFGGLTPAGLTQLSGEIATAAQQTTFDAMSLFMGLLTDPFMDRGGTPATSAAAHGFAEETDLSGKRTDAFAMYTKAPPLAYFDRRWSVWAAGFGGSQTTGGNAVIGSNDTTSRIFGTAVGADYLLAPHTIAGFALAGGGTNFSVNNLGSGRSDLFQAGAYLRHSNGAAYLSAAAAYGWQDITTDRTVTIAGVDRLRAEFNANAWSGRLEGGYRFVAPWAGGLGITPYAAGQFTTFDLPRYMEQAIAGANTFALGYGAKSVTDTRSELGIRTDKSFAMQNGILTLRGRFAWAHDFNPDRAISATFLTLPGASFVVNGAAQAPDSALTTASVEWKWVNGWSAAATFEGQFSKVTESYAGKGVVRYQW